MKYAVVIGASWGPASSARHNNTNRRPFIGLRYDGNEVWVVFDSGNRAERVSNTALHVIQTAFQKMTDAWIEDDVCLYQARNLSAGKQFATRIPAILAAEPRASVTPRPQRGTQ
jgi:hypothetical protein